MRGANGAAARRRDLGRARGISDGGKRSNPAKVGASRLRMISGGDFAIAFSRCGRFASTAFCDAGAVPAWFQWFLRNKRVDFHILITYTSYTFP